MKGRSKFQYLQSAVTQFVVVLLAALIMTGCGGGGTAAGVGNPGVLPVGTSAAIVNLADSPSDRVVSFEITVSSVVLTRSDNTTVTVLASPRRFEVTHMSGTAEPIVLQGIPQGTYTSAKIGISAPDVVYIDNIGHEVEKKDVALNTTVTVALSPALVVGTTPVVLTFDVDVKGSVIIDFATGAVTFTPTLRALVVPVPGAGHENEQEVESGELEHVVGRVSATSGTSFTIEVGQGGLIMQFATDSTTQFEGASGASALANATVRVEGQTRQDGTLFAKEVEVLGAGVESEGLVTATTGSPVTSFTVVLHDGNGLGINSDMLGTSITVNVGAGTRFRVDAGKVKFGGLPLPEFSASTLTKAQRVEAESDSPLGVNNTLTAESVKLQPQALVGAISGSSSNHFTLTVPDDSALKLLTGKNVVTVLTTSDTRFKNMTVTNGVVVKVRGLLFFDPAASTYVMVAGRITQP